MIQLPVTYSVICADALLQQVIPQFNIETALHCEFFCQGLNDTYKVSTVTNSFMLRLYRYQWRTYQEICFEVDALLYLQAQGCNVAAPIPTPKGDYIVKLEAPEGIRYAILTTYAEGKELDFLISENAYLYAQHMAQLHLNTKLFKPVHQRFKLDIKHLITQPLLRIKPLLAHRQKDCVFIESYAQQLTQILQKAFNKSPQLTFCHADLHGGNAHFNGEKLTSFDFDCCGFGLRSYDLAVFKWFLETSKQAPTIWDYFLKSYQQQYPLNDEELALIDAFVSVRQIWLMGLHIDIAVAKGWLDDNYFNQKITFLREQQYLLSRKKSH